MLLVACALNSFFFRFLTEITVTLRDGRISYFAAYVAPLTIAFELTAVLARFECYRFACDLVAVSHLENIRYAVITINTQNPPSTKNTVTGPHWIERSSLRNLCVSGK